MYSKLIALISLIFHASISVQYNGKYLRTLQIDSNIELDTEQESGNIDGIPISCTLFVRKPIANHSEEKDLECELHHDDDGHIVRI